MHVSQVSYETVYAQCVEDSCSCYRGGDCECFCNSISAYVYQCNRHGVAIDWRHGGECCRFTLSPLEIFPAIDFIDYM